jgi:hypothetical protein
VVLALALAVATGGCQAQPVSQTAPVSQGPPASQPTTVGEPIIRCGRWEGPDCNDLLELGQDAVAGSRADVPVVIALGSTCPDNARCMPSSLGGEEVAVVIRWPDGSVDWATIPLPQDWPAGVPGTAVAQVGPPPGHLLALVAGGG